MDWRRVSVLAGIVLAVLVTAMDTTIINTTMPVIAGELGGSDDKSLYAWAFTSYMIFLTVLAPIAGRLSDMYGRKKVLLAGIVLFLFGSLLCGAAQSMLQLVLFRAVQGIGAGIMNPFPAIIAGDLFTVEKRGRIQALFTAMWGLSGIMAPLLGSLFVEYWSWRWIFFVNIPVFVVAFLLLLLYREVYQPRPAAIDYAGAVMFTAGVGLLLMTTVAGSGLVLCAAGGLALLALFWRWERRHASPMLPLDLMRNRPVVLLNLNAFLSHMALFGASTYLPLYLQEHALKDQEWAIFLSGVAMFGMTVGWMSASVPAGSWVMKYGYRPLIVTGNVMQVVSAALFLLMLGRFNDFWFVLVTTIPLGFAFGMLSMVSIIGVQQLVAPDQKGVSTSLQMFARYIGTAFGVTLMGAMIAQAPGVAEGFRWIFLYGVVGSLVTTATAFLIQAERPAREANAGA